MDIEILVKEYLGKYKLYIEEAYYAFKNDYDDLKNCIEDFVGQKCFDLISSFINEFPNAVFTGWHITRGRDLDDIRSNGLFTYKTTEDLIKYAATLLNNFAEFKNEDIDIFKNSVDNYMTKQPSRRVNVVNFYLSEEDALKRSEKNEILLGGEIIRWSILKSNISSEGKNIAEGFLRKGFPVIVSFKCRLSDCTDYNKGEIVKAFFKHELLHIYVGGDSFVIGDACKIGAVDPTDIIAIRRINDYYK